MNHSVGPTASAITVNVGDSTAMTMSETTNISRLPVTFGSICSSIWISVMSEIERLTTCPVRKSSCLAPSSRSNVSNTSLRRSYCTPRDTLPDR